MVVVPFASLLSKSGILFLLLSVTALPSLPSKLAWKLISSNSILTSNCFSAAQISLSLSLSLSLTHSPCLQISLYPPPPPPHWGPQCLFSHVCVCVLFIGSVCVYVCVCKPLCVCVRACAWLCVHTFFCYVLYEDVNFCMFCTLVYYWFV